MLLELPFELLQEIAENLDSRDVLSLCRGNRQLYHLLHTHLYRQDAHKRHPKALDWAIKKDRPDVMQLVIDYAADLVRLSHLTTALETSKIDIFKRLWDILLEHDRILDPTYDENNRNLLHIAVLKRQFEPVEMILGTGEADVDSRDWCRCTALHIAANKGDPDMIRLLLAHGASVTEVEEHGRQPLSICACPSAAWRCVRNVIDLKDDDDAIESIKLLIDHGADLEHTDPLGYTALHRAATIGLVNSVRVLAAHGADVETASHGGETPLHVNSLYRGSLEMARVLLQYGADINAFSAVGRNALWMTQHNDNALPLTRLLFERGIIFTEDIQLNTPLHFCVSPVDTELIDEYLAHGMDINARNDTGNTALLSAISQHTDANETIKHLIKRGADVNIKNHHGDTVLSHAIEKRSLDIVELILESGANLKFKSRYEETVAQLAIRRGTEFVALLKRYGADFSTAATTAPTLRDNLQSEIDEIDDWIANGTL